MLDPVDAAVLNDPWPPDHRISGPLLEAFCAGDDVARSELPRRYEQQLGRMARRAADQVSPSRVSPAFRAQFDQDIVQRSLELLLKNGGYDQARGTPAAYLFLIMRNAARNVFKENGIPFKRSSPDGGTQIQGTLVLSVEADVSTVSDSVGDRHDDFAEKEGELEAFRLIATAPEATQAALQLMAFEDMPLAHAATQTGQSRYALRRKIDGWVKSPAFQIAS